MTTTGYVHGYAPAVQASHGRRTAENSAAYLLPHLRPGASLLDVGCGVGSITADLAARVAPGRVAAVDVSAEVLETARAAAAARGVHVEFGVADAYELPYADGTFDVVHAHQVLQHVAEPVRLLREMRRVARPGGVVAVREADFATTHFHPELPGLTAWLDGYRATARAGSGDPHAGAKLLAWAREAGFAEITPSASVWTFATPDSRAWWGSTWAERVEASTLTERLRAGGVEQDGIEAMAADWRAWTQHPDGWMTMVHGELLCRA
ncbi:methyltransferase domain-containing protein [Kineococcus sp. SYSU DK003]|uniref:methyltransferase domain-containing protein n=1 Tax=Kineococcus sp. SYSU DK003 TaxID=3383124 RepID=UPI003D7E7926